MAPETATITIRRVVFLEFIAGVANARVSINMPITKYEGKTPAYSAKATHN
jgi:type III secretory pathway lipoprotein EscJ